MKYEIRFGCGHKGVVDLIGRETERKRKLWGYEHYGKCDACLAKEKELKAEQEKAKAEKLGLPQLDGSEKQIAWAEDIRAKLLNSKKYESFFTQFFERRQDAIDLYNSAEWDEYMKKPNKRTFDVALFYWYKLITEASAKYYIDNRFEFEI